ncbi:MAG: hypothetical protein V3R81_00955 [Gammaproteobacteria bacterium]
MTDNTNLTFDDLLKTVREIEKAAPPKFYVATSGIPQDSFGQMEETPFFPACYLFNPEDVFFMQFGLAVLGLPPLKHISEWIPPPLKKFTPTWGQGRMKDEVWKWKWRF